MTVCDMCYEPLDVFMKDSFMVFDAGKIIEESYCLCPKCKKKLKKYIKFEQTKNKHK